MKVLLASESAYRRQLLQQINLKFNAQAPTVDEDHLKKMAPVSLSDLPLYLAKKKAESLLSANPGGITIGCDQMGLLKGQPLNKPGTKDKAIEQLKKMQGQTHQLITAMAVHYKHVWETHTDITLLRMKPLTETQIRHYVDLENPVNCAGSYKIEGLGLTLFESIETKDHTAIIGLPVMALCRILEKFGHQVI